MLAQSMMWAIKINYFPIFTSLILGCFHQLIYPIKFDFSISVAAPYKVLVQSSVKSGFGLHKYFPIASFEPLKC